MTPKIYWRQHFHLYASEALDILRIIASNSESIHSMYIVICSVSGNEALFQKLVMLLYGMRRFMGPMDNCETAQHLVSSIESGVWPCFDKTWYWGAHPIREYPSEPK